MRRKTIISIETYSSLIDIFYFKKVCHSLPMSLVPPSELRGLHLFFSPALAF